MTKFRKKRVIIEAWRWDESNATFTMLRGMGMEWMGHKGHRDHPDLCWDLRIKTLEGSLNVAPGDWIIRGVKGEFYPIKDEIFRETYESADVADPLEAQTAEIERLREQITALSGPAAALIADVSVRHPEEELHCPHMRSLADALAALGSTCIGQAMTNPPPSSQRDET